MSGTQYSEKFRARMVEKMAGPQPLTALALAAETGVCQSTLSRWLRDATTLRQKMAKRHGDEEQKLVAADAPQRAAEEKFSLVLEAATVAEAELGEWLRRRGVHAAQLEEWRTQAMAGLAGAAKRSRETATDARQIRELERELARKDKALAEAAALLVLQKKVRAIWGEEDDDTDEKKDK